MTSLLLPSSATLLAYKRLVDCVEVLQRKVVTDVFDVGFFAGAENVRVNAAERQVLGLARAAQAMFEAGPKADLAERAASPAGRAGAEQVRRPRQRRLRACRLRRRLCAGRGVGDERDPARNARPEPEPGRRRNDAARCTCR